LKEGYPHFSSYIKLNEAMRIRFVVGFTPAGDGDEEFWPRVVGWCEAIIKEVFGGHPDERNGGGITREAIIINEGGDDVGGALTEVSVEPIVKGRDGDFSLRGY
jgi:hypothetical protein